MSRESRRAAARPRERPVAGEPTILSFPVARPSVEAEPLLSLHGYYTVNGVPIHFVGERWKAEDAEASPSPVTPDPFNEGIMLTSRMETELKGVTICPVSFEEYRALVRAFDESRPSKIR